MQSTITAIGLPLFYMCIGSIGAIPLVYLMIVYLAGDKFQDGIKLRHCDRDKLSWRKIPVAIKVFAYYVKLAVVPHKLAFFHELGYDYDRNPNQRRITEAVDKTFWMSLGVVFATIAVGFLINWKATVFFFCLISAFGQYKVMGQFVAERYLYLPMIGLLAVIATVAPTEIFWAYAGALAYRAWVYVPTFRNIEALYQASADNFPNSPVGHCALGSHYLEKDVAKVFPALNSALKAEPNNFETLLNMSTYYIIGKHPPLAKQYLDKAREVFKDIDQPEFGEVLDNQERTIVELEKSHVTKKQSAKV